jgi:hypothetical protein
LLVLTEEEEEEEEEEEVAAVLDIDVLPGSEGIRETKGKGGV